MPTIPLYLFTGPEFGEKNDAIQELKDKFNKKFGQVDFYSYYATETNISDVLSILSNGSLFSSARFAVFRNAELLKKKDEIEALSQWAKIIEKQDSADNVLILVSDENTVDKKIENIVPKENRKMFWEMFEDRKVPWIKNFFIKNGYRIEEDAAETILNLIENNTEDLRNECSRFFVCFEKDHVINSDDVEQILAHNREESSFTLFDALSDSDLPMEKRLDKSLEIISKIRHSKESSSVVIIAGLLYCFRQLKTWILLHDSKWPSDLDLKINGFSSKKVQSRNQKAAKIWDLRQTQQCISLLSDTDMQIRSMGTALEDTMIQTMIYLLITHKGSSLIEYPQNQEAF